MNCRYLILVVVFFTFLLNTPAFAGQEAVKVAVLTDMSGPYAAIIASNVDAARMAVDDFGGHVLGKKIEFFYRDFQLKPELANQMASELYEKSKVDAIFDVPNSTAALAVSHKAKLNKKLFFSVSSGTTRHTGKDCNKYTFDWCWSTYMQATAVGLWAAENIGKKWFAITADYEWGYDLLKHFKNALKEKGGVLLGNEMAPLGTADFTRYLLKAKKANPDVLLLLNAGRDNISAVKEAIKIGIKEKIAFIQPALYIGALNAAGEDVYAGDYGALSWYWEINNPGSKEFVKKWFKKFNHPPNTFNVGTYSAVLQYLKAVERAGSKNVEDVVKQLEDHTFNDIFANPGHIRSQDHMQVGKAYIVKVKKAKDVQKPYAFFQIVGQVSAQDAYMDPKDKDCNMGDFK
ncbi:MAG: ABC transporter substrate-binding protein [Desulfobacteraceae bacterium]|nr:ABC transporter substrate-binding protein [Desulfobacteraceae bacterium]